MKIIKSLSKVLVYLMVLSLMICAVYAAQLPVSLGTAGSFVVLAKSGISTTGTTAIAGDIGVSPISSAGITGFSLILDSSTQFSTSSRVTGKVFASDYSVPTPGKMTIAISNMEAAYIDAAGRTIPDQTELGTGDVSGMTLTPGLYKWSTGLLINTGIVPDTNGVTLNCLGNPNAVFIFQIAQDLTVGSGAKVTLINGCLSKNIFWQVGGQAVLGTTSSFSGIILSKTLIAMNTGASLNGRALAQTAVTLDSNTVFVSTGNNANLATLNVTKVVINDNNGTKIVENFILKVNGKTVNSSQQNVLVPGNYAVTETLDANYKAIFSGDCNIAGVVNLKAGQNKICIITNNDIPPFNPNATLRVIKRIINDDGGIKNASDFQLKVGNSTVISGEAIILSAGRYVVSEVSDPLYKASFERDCSNSGMITLRAGDNKTCIIVNNDIRPYNPNATLTVIKSVINDNGGVKNASDFVLLVNNNPVISGVPNILSAGRYTVKEISDPKYTASYSKDCLYPGSIALRAGDNKTCIITNNDIRPYNPNATLTVIKRVINDDNGTKNASDFTLSVGNKIVISGVPNSFAAGSYVIAEVPDPSYQASYSKDCSCAPINLRAGDNKTCIITNNDIRTFRRR